MKNSYFGTVCNLWIACETVKTIGEKIKNTRKLNKLNQIEFSQIIGVSQGTLSELEKDKYKPSLETVIALKLK